MLVTMPLFTDRFPSVLIVDDDVTILELLAEGFQLFGCQVLTAENGLEAWTLFNSHAIDIVLTDIRMPGMDGMQLSQRIRSQSPSVRIGVMTGGDAHAANKLLEDGTADYYFQKPFDLMGACKSMVGEAQTA